MIGQTKVRDKIKQLIDNNRCPSFIVLIAPRGYGKRTLAKYISYMLNATYAPCGAKVDEIREVIDTAYKVREKVLYCIEDGDLMRNEAKNAMLKITEEPPESAYFCLNVSDERYLLDTIRSRGTVFHLDLYSMNELKQYYGTLDSTKTLDEKLYQIANCPGELNLLMQYGSDFLEYVDLVMDNIAEVEPANAFKSSSKLALKTDEGYDLNLFFRSFCWECINRIKQDPLRYSQGVLATSPFVNQSMQSGVNKQQLYDMWVFKIREVWL